MWNHIYTFDCCSPVHFFTKCVFHQVRSAVCKKWLLNNKTKWLFHYLQNLQYFNVEVLVFQTQLM